MDAIKDFLSPEVIWFLIGLVLLVLELLLPGLIVGFFGINAVNLRIAEQYLNEFGKLAQVNNSMIIPTNLADIAGVIQAATSVIKDQTPAAPAAC